MSNSPHCLSGVLNDAGDPLLYAHNTLFQAKAASPFANDSAGVTQLAIV